MGTPMVVDGFLVVVVGGIGSLLGSVLSATLLGTDRWRVRIPHQRRPGPGGECLAFVILVLIARPQGLFALKGGRS